MPRDPLYSPRLEFLAEFRFKRTDGQLGVMNRRYFSTAKDALRFLDSNGDAAHVLTIRRREVGTWEHVQRPDIEQDALEEQRR